MVLLISVSIGAMLYSFLGTPYRRLDYTSGCTMLR
jgi:hypothetical protein